ncbi:hypothetical protein B566_EDAN010060 [Ephemera danica]|nr:hypothetical protein B566_EDAN010060 [Ephemera danica]
MCTWLLVSMAPNAREEVEGEVGIYVNQQSWTLAHVQKLLVLAISSGYISTLATALKVFSPENPLCSLIHSIQCCAVDKNFDDSVENIHIFKAKCQNLPVAVSSPEEGSFLCDRQWVYATAVQLVCTTLARSFTSTFYQYRFLQMLCQTEFSEFITVESPDFAHLQQLQECLLETGVQLDYSALCLERRGSERELQACLDRLVLTHNFAQALKLARIAGLPRDSVVMAQWNNAIEQLENTTEIDRDFWKKCQSAFEEANIQPLVAAEFFQQHADTRDSKAERYDVLIFMKLSMRKRPDCYLTKAVEVELEMWKARLQLHVSEETEDKGPPKLFTKTKKEVMAEAGVGYLELETRLKDVEQIAALDSVIGDLLDQGDISTAVRLEGLFCHKNRDVQILLTCMSLAEGEIQACQLSSEQRMMIDNSFTTPSSFRKRPLHSLRVPSFTSLSPSPQSPQSALNSSGEYLEMPAKEQQDTLTALEKLSERLQHGKFIGARITACYRVAVGIEKAFVVCNYGYLSFHRIKYVFQFQDIITIDDPLSLLKSAISKDCLNKFAVASDLSSGNQISKETMVQFLCEEIMTAVSKGHMQGEAACAFPPAGGIMWGCELDSCFHLVLELCPDSSLLGNELLNVASRFTSSQHEGAKQVHSVLVELLIRAHDCFTASCDMEGITKVLQKSRTLTPGLLQQEQWQLMVRMVTGIGRYTEMNYIFQILKDHQRFEFLLGKGMDKVPGLKLALLEFVRSRCAEDRELLRMVALHFRLYSQVAQLWDSEARTTVHRLLNITKLELGTKLFNQNNLLRASQDTVHLLKLAMQNYTHAAEYYLQADKLIKAMHSSHQAELVALQISMVNGVAAGQTVDCLLERESEGVNKLIYHQLSFPQTVIVARAYSHSVDWGLALFNHCVLQTEHKYLTDFTQTMNLTPTLVEDVVKRFHASQKSAKSPKAVPQEMYWVMKQMVNMVQCVEVKYRLASLLGFKDVLENMVTSPALPFLKDTVWRKSSKH